MALINMQMSKEEAKEYSQPTELDAPQYPYGLCIDLNDDSLEKLGLTQLPTVGSEMMIQAKVVVTSVSSNQTQGGEAEARASLQITDMELVGKDTSKSAASKLYGD